MTVLSGCGVRAVLQLEAEEKHYLGSILFRLKGLYETEERSNIREQLSDEIGWLEARLGIAE